MQAFASADGDLQFISEDGAPPSGFSPVHVDDSARLAPQKDIVVSGGRVVLRSTLTRWHIDQNGAWYPGPASDRQALDVAWGTPLVRDAGGQWRTKSIAEAIAPAIKAECGRRILEVASANCQMNMTAARAAGAMSSGDQSTYAAALGWVAAMRAKCAELIAVADSAYSQDAKWPTIPAGVSALCAKY